MKDNIEVRIYGQEKILPALPKAIPVILIGIITVGTFSKSLWIYNGVNSAVAESAAMDSPYANIKGLLVDLNHEKKRWDRKPIKTILKP